jgi:hypothetical protein
MNPTTEIPTSPFPTMARLACVSLVVINCNPTALADPIDLSPVGLAVPESIITFSERALTDTSQVSTEFADLGVTFLPNLFYRTGDNPDWASVEGPNLRTGDPEVNPFSIHFESALTSAAFVAIAQPPTSATITAKLGGVEVESFETTVSIDNPENYFGFSDIVFDEIEIAYTEDTRLRIDNIQLGPSANLAPLIITDIDVTEGAESKSVTLIWQSRPGRTYALFVSEDLQTWTELNDSIDSEGAQTSFTDEAISKEENSRYYRVEDTAR